MGPGRRGREVGRRFLTKVNLTNLTIMRNEASYSLILSIFHETFKLPNEFSVLNKCLTL